MNVNGKSSISGNNRKIAIVAIGLGVVSFALPAIGFLGIILGVVAWRTGSKLGKIATLLSITGLICGTLVYNLFLDRTPERDDTEFQFRFDDGGVFDDIVEDRCALEEYRDSVICNP
jgi:hypothetical protein